MLNNWCAKNLDFKQCIAYLKLLISTSSKLLCSSSILCFYWRLRPTGRTWSLCWMVDKRRWHVIWLLTYNVKKGTLEQNFLSLGEPNGFLSLGRCFLWKHLLWKVFIKGRTLVSLSNVIMYNFYRDSQHHLAIFRSPLIKRLKITMQEL